MAKEVYGIDLGTTNSCIAIVDENGIPQVLPNNYGFYTTPSVVYFEEDNITVTVGDDAKRLMVGAPDRAVAFIKREMGNESYDRSIDGIGKITPIEISSMILKKLVSDANAYRAESDLPPVKDAIITVPAYFGNTERELTRQAGELAGLNVLQLLNEPTAAAYSYGAKGLQGKTFMVYDLGGGTFDISIMRVTGDRFEELSSDGDHHLGGIDWDVKLMNHCLSESGLGFEYDEMKDSFEAGQWLINSEQAKKNLTKSPKTNLTLRYKRPYTVEVTREDFEDMTSDMVDDTILMMRSAIKNATVPLKATDIDEILLVGGSSFMPMIKNAVCEAFPNAKVRLDMLKPNRAIAEGAAIYGHRLVTKQMASQDEQSKDILLATRSYGISCYNENGEEIVSNIVKRNEAVGTEKRSEFITRSEGQTSCTLSVFENKSREDVAHIDRSLHIASNDLVWKVPVPKGTPIVVKMRLSPDGTLRVYGECHGHQATFDVTVKGASEEEREDARKMINRLSIG